MTEVEERRSQVDLHPCWSCKGPVGHCSLFCSTCGALQPPNGADHFARLGLPRTYALDPALLERQYFGFQRRLHPDRFANRSPKERALSQSQAVALNEAYETLKDPMKRSAYLLRLAGASVETDGAQTINDPAMLVEAMEMREALAEAESPEEVAELAAKAEADVTDCQSDIAEAFARDDLKAASRATTRLKYLSKLAEEARSRRIRLSRREA